MTAASANRQTEAAVPGPIGRRIRHLPLAAAVHIFLGTMYALNSAGYVVPASADPSLRVIGVSTEEVDNSAGIAGAKSVAGERRVEGFANSTGISAITTAHIGRTCYAVDDQTVSLTNPLGTYPVAGRVYDVERGLVFVEVGILPDDAGGVSDLHIVTAADLSTRQGRFVALNSSGLLVLAATAGQNALGVLLNAPDNGAVGVVRRRGLARVVAEEVVTEGQNIAVAVTTGRAKVAAAGTVSGSNVVGSYVMGQALEESIGAGDLFLADIQPIGAVPTTLG